MVQVYLQTLLIWTTHVFHSKGMFDSRPLPLHQETHGAEDSEDSAGVLGSVGTGCVQNGPCTVSAPCRLLTARPPYTIYTVSWAVGTVRPVRVRMSLHGEDHAWDAEDLESESTILKQADIGALQTLLGFMQPEAASEKSLRWTENWTHRRWQPTAEQKFQCVTTRRWSVCV